MGLAGSTAGPAGKGEADHNRGATPKARYTRPLLAGLPARLEVGTEAQKQRPRPAGITGRAANKLTGTTRRMRVAGEQAAATRANSNARRQTGRDGGGTATADKPAQDLSKAGPSEPNLRSAGCDEQKKEHWWGKLRADANSSPDKPASNAQRRTRGGTDSGDNPGPGRCKAATEVANSAQLLRSNEPGQPRRPPTRCKRSW